MVSVHYRVSCSCGASRTKGVESGNDDQWNTDFDCSHWKCEIKQQTKLGYFFGSNAQVKLYFYPKCKNSSNTFSYNCTFWGWNNSDRTFQTYECCGQRLGIEVKQDGHWGPVVVQPVYAINNSVIGTKYMPS